MSRSCLIVGAGMAGLTAATTLQNAGWHTRVLDKGRGAGGRMATRRIEGARFDHGAQFFTARDPRFQEAVQGWEAEGVVAPWHTSASGHVRYRGVEGMSSVPKRLARDLVVETSSRVVGIEPVDGRWSACLENGQRRDADVLILTAPPEQSLALCEPFRPLLGRRIVQALQAAHFDPCYSLMVLTDGPSGVPEPGIESLEEDRVLQTVADNTRKGISEGGAALTLHATPRFTLEHWDDAPGAVAERMLEAASSYISSPVITWQLHRWRYAQPAQPAGASFLTTKCPAPLCFAGDAFGGPRVEGAFVSGLEAAQHLLAAAAGA